MSSLYFYRLSKFTTLIKTMMKTISKIFSHYFNFTPEIQYIFLPFLDIRIQVVGLFLIHKRMRLLLLRNEFIGGCHTLFLQIRIIFT